MQDEVITVHEGPGGLYSSDVVPEDSIPPRPHAKIDDIEPDDIRAAVEWLVIKAITEPDDRDAVEGEVNNVVMPASDPVSRPPVKKIFVPRVKCNGLSYATGCPFFGASHQQTIGKIGLEPAKPPRGAPRQNHT
jgi:hypothetical protein